jgi:hypothetical protein
MSDMKVVPPPSLSILRPVRMNGIETYADIFHGKFLYPHILSVDVDPELVLLAKGIKPNPNINPNQNASSSSSSSSSDWRSVLKQSVDDFLYGSSNQNQNNISLLQQEQQAETKLSALLGDIPSSSSSSSSSSSVNHMTFDNNVNTSGFELNDQLQTRLSQYISNDVNIGSVPTSFGNPFGNASTSFMYNNNNNNSNNNNNGANDVTIPDQLMSNLMSYGPNIHSSFVPSTSASSSSSQGFMTIPPFQNQSGFYY